MDGDQVIGDELELGAVAEGADIVRRARETLEHRQGLVVGGLVAAAIDQHVADHGAVGGARQRAVEHDDADRLQPLEGRGLVLDRQRAGFGDDAAGLWCLDQIVDDADQRLARRHRGDDDLGFGQHRGIGWSCACHRVSSNFAIAAGAMSWPMTSKPDSIRFLAIAVPMMPTPMMPAVPLLAMSFLCSCRQVKF